MIINFYELTARNFLSYDDLKIVFEPGKHIILGRKISKNADSNGAGKSSILDALVMLLYNYIPRTKDPSKNKKGDSYVHGKFQIEDKVYEIKRYIKDANRGNDIILLCNNENISSRNPTDTQKEILRIIGMSYDLFVSNIIVMQGLPVNFTALTPTSKKSLLEDLLGFSLWDNFKNKISKKLDIITLKYNEINNEYTKFREQMIEKNSKLETLEKVKSDMEDNTGEQILLIKDNIKIRKQRLTHLYDQITLILNGRTLEEIKNNIDLLSKTLNELNLKSSYNIKILVDKKCPTCNRDYPENMLSQIHQNQGLITNDINITTGRFDENKVLQDSLNKLYNDVNTVTNEVTNFMSQLKTFMSQSTISEDTIDSTRKEVTELHKKVNEIFYTLQEMNTIIKHRKYVIGLLMPSSEFRSIILNNYLNYINSIIEEINPIIFDEVKMQLSITPDKKGVALNIINTQGISFDYKEYSGGEKRRIDSIIILAFQKFLLDISNISTNLIMYDEILEGVDYKGVECILSSLDLLYSESLCFYLISHNDKNKAIFDNVLIVNNVNDNSYIEVE